MSASGHADTSPLTTLSSQATTPLNTRTALPMTTTPQTYPLLSPPPPLSPRPTPQPVPSTACPSTFLTLNNFRITTTKRPILNSSEIDAATSRLGIAPPEMIFGNNEVRIEYLSPQIHADAEITAAGECEDSQQASLPRRVLWGISFNALDALDLVDKTGAKGMLKVAYSEEWQKQREKVHGASIKEYVRPFDWSYTTSYRGTILPCDMEHCKKAKHEEEEKSHAYLLLPHPTAVLPKDLLVLPDPIVLFDNIILYEDELADNGISLYSIKIRVMPHRLLLLARFFLRLDDVLFRIRDTRVYIDFAIPGAKGEGERPDGAPSVSREYLEKEASWALVLQRMANDGVRKSEVASVLRDAARVDAWLGEPVRREMECLMLR